MDADRTYASYAILHELRRRELRKKIDLFPEDLRYYAILANSIIGTEMARRSEETPKAVHDDGASFVDKLLAMAPPEGDDRFRVILETCLIDSMKDELKACCQNCAGFAECLDMESSKAGPLFRLRTAGEDTEEVRKGLDLELERLLTRTPYTETEDANKLCKDFRHQYTPSAIGEVFGRYADIAMELQDRYGIEYRKIQQQMIVLNMEFVGKGGRGGHF